MPGSVPAALVSGGLGYDRAWNRNLYGVGLRPHCFARGEVQAVHGDRYLLAIDFNHQIVVIHFLALKGIVWCSLNRIGMSASSAGNEISDSAMLVALVVMDVAREDDDAVTGTSLVRLQVFR